ncbi:TonB-dependent receptor [Phenylobacterium sp.]|uniref:TonB-dependent receptor n=1 Tax=Phenylobacterium sp. TaxID=1871053 RepID=UPI002619C812|nr:TonB-dependent receptor [Phenylobacterium sp.]
MAARISRRRVERRAATCALGLLVACGPLGLHAQTAPASPAHAARADPPPKRNTVSELVITGGEPTQPGAVMGDIKPELQISPEEIQSYGVSSVTELLDELAPQIRSDRGRGGEAPVVLLNGRRISGFGEIRNIPAEAILRVDILPEEAALKYGYAANQRVVNIVLRPVFRAWTAEGQAGAPTEGGQALGQGELDQARIRGDNRLNLDLKAQVQTALTEAERDVVPLTAGEDGRFRTLSPSTRQLDANAVFARVYGPISASFNATLGATHSDSLQGLPRGEAQGDPLRQTSDSWTAHLGGTLNGQLRKWRLSLTGGYDHSDNLTHSEVGAAAVGLGPVGVADDPGVLTLGVGDRTRNEARSLSDGFNVHFLVAGSGVSLPAGAVFTSLKVGDAASWFASDALRAGLQQSVSFSRNDLSVQGSVDVPIASRRNGVLAWLGEAHLNANAALDQLSDFGSVTTLGYGLNWRPLDGLAVIASHTREEAAPSFQQLGAPTLVTPGVRMFDFVTGTTALVRSVTGGNPLLSSDHREVTKLGLNWKPAFDQDLTLSANYVISRTDNAISTFPAVTAEIEAAFPGRFVRDATGALVQVDERPVNFSSLTKSDLRWGINYSRPIGPQPPPRNFARRAGGDGARAFGGAPGGGRVGGRGGGRGGGFGGPFGGRAPPGRVTFSLYHTVIFEDRTVVRPGGPIFDLLHGSPGAQPRHEIEAQGGVYWKGLGVRLNADWKSSTFVRGEAGSAVGDLAFSDVAKVNLRLFADLGQERELVAKYPILHGARLTLSVANLFGARQRVRDASGATPLAFQPDILDPAGRIVRLSFRKVFD